MSAPAHFARGQWPCRDKGLCLGTARGQGRALGTWPAPAQGAALEMHGLGRAESAQMEGARPGVTTAPSVTPFFFDDEV